MNIFELFGIIAINNEAANKAITDTGSKASRLASTMNTSFDKIGKMAVQCGKVIASGMAVGAAAVGAIVKSSIEEYAEYEQLVGGVETLFKESSDKVTQYAKQAYRNQGLSANAYMSQVTSFSAALISGLNGDTAAAAKMADIAITDMSDNANTFGTDISMIQNAYQGFAKQNYTMLDNLKLGYGGTAEEMARLINESGVLGSAVELTAKTVNGVSFDVIIAAIHEVQTEMGITGRTAQEAAETISGSWGSLKGAWSNLLVGLANDEDMKPLADALLETGNTFTNNIAERLPVIKDNFIETFTYIAENSGEILSTLGAAIDGLFNIDASDLSTLQAIAGLAAIAKGHYGIGAALIGGSVYAEFQAEKKVMEENAAALPEASDHLWDEFEPYLKGSIGETSAAWEAYKAFSLTDDPYHLASFLAGITGDSSYLDGYTHKEAETADVVESYKYGSGTPSNSIPMPSTEEIIEGLTNGTFQDPMGGFGMPSSNNELQTTIQNWTNTFDANVIAETIATKVSEAVTSAMGGITITTGDVTLNDGALVGRILPRINLRLGQLTMQRARGNA